MLVLPVFEPAVHPLGAMNCSFGGSATTGAVLAVVLESPILLEFTMAMNASRSASTMVPEPSSLMK